MDIRIVNTCNSDCMYCLEQSLRNQEKHIPKQKILTVLSSYRGQYPKDTILSFYGGNPLLHPDLVEITSFARDMGFENISLLSNTKGLTSDHVQELSRNGLSYISVYFNSFSQGIHDTIVQQGISLEELLSNIQLLSQKKMLLKLIIHINRKNISSLYKDILKLYRVFGIKNIDFVNYFPFDRPYDTYKNDLSYESHDYRKSISALFEVLAHCHIESRFMKFPRTFFGKYIQHYDYTFGVENQIGIEDKERLATKTAPFCKIQERCPTCFIQDNCDFYGV